MIVKEMGPFAVFSRLRANRARKQKRIGGTYDMLSCVGCVSVYVGAVTAVGAAGSVLEWIWYTFAFSAIAVFLEALYERIRKVS